MLGFLPTRAYRPGTPGATTFLSPLSGTFNYGWDSFDLKIEYIQPGKPIQNCFVESFLGSFRDECLNLHWFLSLRDARHTIERWRQDYNRVRPHSALGDLPPADFALNHHMESGNKRIN